MTIKISSRYTKIKKSSEDPVHHPETPKRAIHPWIRVEANSEAEILVMGIASGHLVERSITVRM